MPTRFSAFSNLTFLLIALFLAPYRAWAHDIPNDVTIQAFIKPAGDRLNYLVRVPLRAMRDMEFPSKGQGYLDLDRLESVLPDAATLWLSDFTELYEGDTRLVKPKVVETRVSLPSDKSFATYEEALAHVTGPRLPNDMNLVWDQVMFDVLFEYPIHSDQS